MSTRVFSSVGLLLVAANLFALRGTAAESPTAAGEIGLKIGDPAPGFTLKDQNGLEVSLSDLVKKGPVAVVFHRSAEWCLFCKFELRHLQRNLRKFEAEGGQVVAISYDSSDILKKFADSRSRSRFSQTRAARLSTLSRCSTGAPPTRRTDSRLTSLSCSIRAASSVTSWST